MKFPMVGCKLHTNQTTTDDLTVKEEKQMPISDKGKVSPPSLTCLLEFEPDFHPEYFACCNDLFQPSDWLAESDVAET